MELTDALYWGIIPRGLVAREQPPLPSNKTGEMFFRGGRRLYMAWLFLYRELARAKSEALFNTSRVFIVSSKKI